MWSGFEAGSYLRLIDFVYHSYLGLRVIKKKREAPLLDTPYTLLPGLSTEGSSVRLD